MRVHNIDKKGDIKSNITYISKVFLLFILIGMFTFGFRTEKSKANTLGQVNVTVDYLEEIITVTPGSGGSTKLYMSTDKKKTWELLDDSGVVDISTLLSTKSVTLYFKGNKDLTAKEVVLAGEDKSLQASYKVLNGAGAIVFTPVQTVEYKKGVNGTWKQTSSPIPTSIYEINGATIYIRTPATVFKRAGKVVTVKVPKKPSAPSVKLDGSKLSITGLKAGETQYRVGDSTTWITFSSTDKKTNALDLNTILNPGAIANTPIPAGRIEFRNSGSDKKPTSRVKVLEIVQQSTAPENVVLSGTTLIISDSDTKKAYEYTIVPINSTLNLDKAKWTSVTSKKPVIIKNASVGDKILVRLKSTTDSTTKQVILASTYKEFTVTEITKVYK